MITKRQLIATIFFLVPAGVVACGGKAVIDGDGAGGATSTVGPTTSVVTSVGTTSTSASSSTGMVDGVTLTLSNPSYIADCMPVVPDDPLGGSVEVTITNNTEGEIVVDDVLDIEISSAAGTTFYTSFGDIFAIKPGGEFFNVVAKPNMSASGDNACVHCGLPVTLRGTIPTDLGPISDEIETTIMCAL